jgi:hypothetical protein
MPGIEADEAESPPEMERLTGLDGQSCGGPALNEGKKATETDATRGRGGSVYMYASRCLPRAPNPIERLAGAGRGVHAERNYRAGGACMYVRVQSGVVVSCSVV